MTYDWYCTLYSTSTLAAVSHDEMEGNEKGLEGSDGVVFKMLNERVVVFAFEKLIMIQPNVRVAGFMAIQALNSVLDAMGAA